MNANFRINIPVTVIAKTQREPMSVTAGKAQKGTPVLEIAPSMKIFPFMLKWSFVSVLYGYESFKLKIDIKLSKPNKSYVSTDKQSGTIHLSASFSFAFSSPIMSNRNRSVCLPSYI